MDKTSWLWKKKSSDKQALDKAAAVLDSTTASGTSSIQIYKVKYDNNKKPKYVQISVESYTYLTELEDQAKSWEEEVRSLEAEVEELNEKLFNANLEMTNKENLVKQQAKVAEEAVSGWEKADAEAASLKNHLESVTLLRLTAEDRVSHLEGALRECMTQIRNLKEEHDEKLQDVVLNKAMQFDKMKLELETKITSLDQELMVSGAENAALSRSLQERSSLLIKINEEKLQAQAEMQRLKVNIESFEKEAHSLKYELHVARKEVEIRCEEKNMSLRSAEVASKQHLDGVKKIAKLEAECQRLRGLVRKKLPGPGALAQMKLEVENLGRDYGECQLPRSPLKPHSHHFSQFDNTSMYQKENELLTERILVMEEEMKMLKEALAKRNSELLTSRSLYAETTSKLESLRIHVESNDESRSPMRRNAQIPNESFSTKKGSNRLSFTSASEDGNDDNTSCAGSFAPVLTSDTSNHLDLMHDFLEMEKMACLSIGSNADSNSSVAGNSSHVSAIEKNENSCLSEDNGTSENSKLKVDQLIFVKLQSRISMVLESISTEKDLEKVLDKVKLAMQDMLETLDRKGMNQQLDIALSQLCDFVKTLGNEDRATPRAHGLNQKVNWFSAKYTGTLTSEINLIDFVLDMSHVIGLKTSERETGNSVYIDKVALPENKVVPDSSRTANFSDSASDPDAANDGIVVPLSESTTSSWKCTMEEFEQLKPERDNLVSDLAKCVENFESTRSKLLETEKQLSEVKSQLAATLKSSSLAETQLKCMAESYKSLETRAEELQSEIDILQGKIKVLENELQEEMKGHQDALAKVDDLQEQLLRVECFTATDKDNRTSQELAAAAERLAECQETIFLLGKQLKAFHPPAKIQTLQDKEAIQNDKAPVNEEPPKNGTNSQQSYPYETEAASSFTVYNTGSESPSSKFNSHLSPLRFEAKNPPKSPKNPMHSRHSPSKSGSSSSSARGFSRFFFVKEKNGP